MSNKNEKKQHPHEHGKHPEKDKPVDPKAGATPQDDPGGGTDDLGDNDPDGDGDIDTPPQGPGNP